MYVILLVIVVFFVIFVFVTVVIGNNTCNDKNWNKELAKSMWL